MASGVICIAPSTGQVRRPTSRLSTRRNVAAAKAFFRKAVKGQRRAPETIAFDGYTACHRAVRELRVDGSLPLATKLR